MFEHLSLSIPAGRTTVLMGPSGAGKTTLLRHLLGLREPDGGRVYVDGRAVDAMASAELRQLRHNMGVLLGGSSVYDTSLFASSSVFDNVVSAAEGDRRMFVLVLMMAAVAVALAIGFLGNPMVFCAEVEHQHGRRDRSGGPEDAGPAALP